MPKNAPYDVDGKPKNVLYIKDYLLRDPFAYEAPTPEQKEAYDNAYKALKHLKATYKEAGWKRKQIFHEILGLACKFQK